MLVLVGVALDDSEATAQKLAHKLINYRLFTDSNGKMNLSLAQTGKDILLVPQFTLVAETKKGMRPGFSRGAPPAQAIQLFDYLAGLIKSQAPRGIGTGHFGADMQVSLVNDGPVTFWIEV